MNSSTSVGRAAAAIALRALPAVAGMLALALMGCGLQPSERVVKPVGPALSQALSADYTIAPAAAAVEAPTSAPVAAPTLGTITVYTTNLRFVPTISSIDTPGRYTVRLINNDQLPHVVTLPDGSRLSVEPGRTIEGEMMIGEAGISFICDVPGHRDAGMVGQVSVERPQTVGRLAP